MADLDLREYSDYEDFARGWHADTFDQHDASLEQTRDRGLINEDDTRLLWELLGQLDSGGRWGRILLPIQSLDSNTVSV